MARIPQKLQVWVDIRKKFRLSHAHVQMARALGLNPKKLGSKANHRQEPWKAPLPQFIEDLYWKRFGKTRPDRVASIEEIAKSIETKKARQRERPRLNAKARGEEAHASGPGISDAAGARG